MFTIIIGVLLCFTLVGPSHADLTSETFKTIFACDGAATTFDYDFKVFEDSELEVILYTISDGTELTLTLTTDYAVSDISSTGGRVTTVSTYSALYQLIVRRDQPFTQELDYTQGDILSTTVLEKQLDQIVMQIQDLLEQVSRSIVQGATSLTQIEFPGVVADEFIGWNSGGTGLENKDLEDLDVIVIDTDGTLAANSDAKVATQKATKTYTMPLTYLDTDGTLAADSDVKVASQKATKTFAMPLSYLDTDNTLAADSDTKIASQKATKYYVDNFGFSVTATVGTFNYDVATATGTQAITGVGFEPSAVMFMASLGDASGSWGFATGPSGSSGTQSMNSISTSYTSTNPAAILYVDSGNTAIGSINSLDADGWTIGWVKSSSPTGTLVIDYIAWE